MRVARSFKTWLLAILLAALGLAACGAQPGTSEPEPPEIRYGHDLCESCGMLIDSPQFAAATITADGAAHRFDDIGDMVIFHQERPAEPAAAWFVHDYDTEGWIRAETAYFVSSPQITTPMGHGLAAFETQAAAQALADKLGASVLSFDMARAAILEMDHAAH